MGVSLQYIQQRVESLCEHNPMLGHRGCRLGNTYPEITQMQTRAILGAALELKKEGVETHPEIMVPLTGILYEFKEQENVIRAEAKKLFEEVGDSIDVGQLVRMATEKGRAIRPDLKCGICGEHGGEPSSVKFCHRVGLNYVSCSPFRVPIARLAAAQAAIEG